MTKSKVLHIQPISRRNRLSLMLLGGALLIVCFVIDLLFWQQYKIQLILINMAALIVFLVGYLKHIQPHNSYTLMPEHLQYHHPWGQWRLPWQDIQRLGLVHTDIQLQRIELPYIGIKLHNLDALAKSISPRLANKLVHEQKQLLVLAIKRGDITFQDGIICFDPFVLNQNAIKGPVAAFLHQCCVLQRAYGYHLFLPKDSFDRSEDEFLSLLKQCHYHAINTYQRNP
ncbi:DUF2982 domain-containing protein [Thalassotalea ponticola]|uniref:DUF2982 domain-containing protein n=1 Tax=Thalassotalea ponticola TaxID=1523392 RepID=UPI0025B28360|nr:DUF2982 domain-containing protein [Thalassotalea ponticola]MDN3653118.1 DUF2982 domain-containing protein [Thalassotalea ponticola]